MLSEEVNYIFWVSHAVHKLLTEARGAERFKASTVVHLETRTRGIHLLMSAGVKMSAELNSPSVELKVSPVCVDSRVFPSRLLLTFQRPAYGQDGKD